MKKTPLTLKTIGLLLIALSSISISWAANPAANPVVRIETNMGNIDIELYPDKAPATVENFLAYADNKHYRQTIFHRVIKGFMIQGGGFTPEYKKKPTRSPIHNEAYNGLKNELGTIAMARTGDPHSATAQFFINTNNNSFLDFQTAPYGPANTLRQSQFGIQDARTGRIATTDCRGRRISRATLQKAKTTGTGGNQSYECLMKAILNDNNYTIDRELSACLPQLKQLRQSGKIGADKTCSDYINNRHLALKLVHVNWGYTVFGKVIEGMDIVRKIDGLQTGAVDRFRKDAPREAVIIKSIQKIQQEQVQ